MLIMKKVRFYRNWNEIKRLLKMLHQVSLAPWMRLNRLRSLREQKGQKL